MIFPNIATGWLFATWGVHELSVFCDPIDFTSMKFFSLSFDLYKLLVSAKHCHYSDILHEKKKKIILFGPTICRFIWCHCFYYWERQWTTDACSPFPCHSPYFMALSYIPSIASLPTWSLLNCVIGSCSYLWSSLLLFSGSSTALPYPFLSWEDEDCTEHSFCVDQVGPW